MDKIKIERCNSIYFSGGGIGCRKCRVIGAYDSQQRHYYYVNFGDRANEPCEERTPEYLELHGRRCDDAASDSQCHAIQTETGVTGRSILLDLYKLYKFDPIKDMTTDKMHLLFNMLKRVFGQDVGRTRC